MSMRLIQRQVDLASMTSWQVGGKADYFAQPRDEAELKSVIQFARDQKFQITILSGGTNVLVSDRGIPGLTIHLSKFSGLTTNESDSHLRISALSGTSKSEVLKVFLKYKLAPALFLAGLPGDLGGGVVMNAGVAEAVAPREFVELTESIEVWKWDTADPSKDIVIQTFKNEELSWTYRHCEGWQPGVITRVNLLWPKTETADVLTQVREANRVRLQKQPLELPSCGSVFKNPPGAKAGQLIEQAGLKGFTIGGAQVSLKHANFIVNHGGANAAEIWELIQVVQKKVEERFQVNLRTEVVRLGIWD